MENSRGKLRSTSAEIKPPKRKSRRMGEAEMSRKRPKSDLMGEEGHFTDGETVKRPVRSGNNKPKSVQKKRRRTGPKQRYKVKEVWWAAPVAIAMAAVLVVLGGFFVRQFGIYGQFLQKKYMVSRAAFYPGVSLEGIDVSEQSFEGVRKEWEKREAKERTKYDIVLTLGEEAWPVNASALGYQSDYLAQLQSAWSVGRYGTLEERYEVIATMRETQWQRDFPISRGLATKFAMEKLEPFAASMSVESVNAKVANFNEIEKSFEFSDGKRGYVVEAAELHQDILRAAESGARSVPINRREIVPKDTAQTLAETYGLVASATTDASFSTSDRLTNLKVSCRTLNGMRIEAGDSFSFNEALGKRTAKAGYRPAAAYENGITTNQYGGGICQVSTTLFNAVAKADLKVTERSPHSRPSSYVAIGKDAAVNWPNQDFKFTNNTEYPIYIVAEVTSKKRVAIGIYGRKLPGGMTIKISSETTKTVPARDDQIKLDPKLAPGEQVVVEKARKGYTAVAYKHYLDANGKEVRKTTLAKSQYAPSGAIIRIGQ